MRGKRCHWLTVGPGPSTCKGGPFAMVQSYFAYNIYIYNIRIYTWKYFQNIYCMYVCLYIHNKYTQYTHI